MANYANLLATIAANIYTNNNNEVTAAMVKSATDAMVASLGAGYQYMGVAHPTDTPSGYADLKCFWLACDAGTYTDFGGVTAEAKLSVITYDGSWTCVPIDLSRIDGIRNLQYFTPASAPWAEVIQEIYLFGSDIDPTHEYVIDRIDKNNVGGYSRFFVKDVTDDEYVITFSPQYVPENFFKLYPDGTGKDAYGYVLMDWSKISTPQNLNLGLSLTYRALNVDASPIIAAALSCNSTKLLSAPTTWILGGINSVTGDVMPSATYRITTRDYFVPDVWMDKKNFDIAANAYFDAIEVVFWGYDKDMNYVGNSGNKESVSYLLATYPATRWVKMSVVFLESSVAIDPAPLDYVKYVSFFGQFVPLLESQSDGDGVDGGVLAGKKWVACGDSFTAGDFTGMVDGYLFTDNPYKGYKKVYPYFIGRRCGMTVIDEAIGGSTMTYIDGTHNEFSTPGGRYTKIDADADYITLYFGINDQGYAPDAVGTIDDNTIETFYGAWNVVMAYLIANHPKAKIGIIVTNGTMEGYTMAPWLEAERAIAKKWGVGFLDMQSADFPYMLRQWDKPGIDPSMARARDAQNRVSAGNWHPSPDCHKYESTIIENFLRSL